MQISRDSIRELLDGGSVGTDIKQALEACAATAGCSDAHVIVADESRSVRVSSGASTNGGPDLALDIGCIAKLITVATFFRIMEPDKAALDRRVSEILEISAPGWNSEIRVRDLINHSHGTDEFLEQLLPLTPEGRIDVKALLGGIGPVPLFPAGRYSSYSGLGSRLLAAMLENKVGARFVDIVRQTFTATMLDAGSDDAFCPAFGGKVHVNAEKLLHQLVRMTSFNGDRSAGRVPLGQVHSREHAGWHPFEQGLCNGWKVYKLGWYGHLSQLSRAPSTRLQVSPGDGLGIMVACTGGHLWKLFYSMLAEAFVGTPNTIPASPPGRHMAQPIGARPDDPSGVYSRVDIDLVVSREGGGLALEARRKVDDPDGRNAQAMHRARLQPLRGQMFAVVPPCAELELGVVEFLSGADGRISHLWNKGRILRRER